MAKFAPSQLDRNCFDALVARVSSERDLKLSPALRVPASSLEYAL
jgi:hypothetical protein